MCATVASFILSGAFTNVAHACSTCGCGDPTLTALGVEKPYRNRIRASLAVQYRTDAVGVERIDRIRLAETRLDAQLAWAPHERVFLLLSVPTVWRSVEYVNLAKQSMFGLGNIELRAKFFVWQDRTFAPQHLLAFTAGIRFPTPDAQRGSDGKPLPPELQVGTQSFDPLAAISYAFFHAPWSLYASVQATYPTQTVDDYRVNPSMRTTVAVQYQVLSWLAPRVGIDSRIDGKAEEQDREARDSGGFIGYASVELLLSPIPDLLVFLSARYPVLNQLSGTHDEGGIYGGGVAHDF